MGFGRLDYAWACACRHLCPSPLSDFKFNSRVRATDESAATYVAALRQIAEHSDYKDSLQDMLQDHLVCGVNDLVIQRWLLAEKDDTALDLAKSLEAAEKESHDITVDNKFEPVQFNSQHQRPENPVNNFEEEEVTWPQSVVSRTRTVINARKEDTQQRYVAQVN